MARFGACLTAYPKHLLVMLKVASTIRKMSSAA